MSRYILIRRLRGPAFLLLVGFIALMAEAHIMSWGHSWPLFLILAGVLALAERAALAAEGYPNYPGGYDASQYPAGQYPPGYPGAPVAAPPAGAPPVPSSTSIVPSSPEDFSSRGGRS